ncbi:NAD(P)-dependent dehydrogenase (short-subunit alcohol dehydrogenase family) [Granulicella aggregans]|uniref:NAD(P)-dependent dehydrogenase (Short-subunit alcohol dehydrogenase family) n=1 Tax=Granulicella aggregans TaxID=474949 RepID=A0A7W7ZE48_9BACT|nr:SDR family NAD(P)-dependent oxidoreductase [Granulicella aggregans]MBB5058078.1 NAD(P)-dependent dehydrogenase (short-subunit alcohol dehydrogenase family) [Granulicella aggregans]
MKISESVVLVTGGNRGIGKAFVAEVLKRGAAKVYVASRDAASIISSEDPRVIPMVLDVTDQAQIADATEVASDVTLLINNAGFAAFEGAISSPDLSNAREEMEVNYFGPLALSRAFKSTLAASGGGAIVNMLSMLSLISLPAAATYSASKAAGLSVTRSIRAELAAQGTLVVGVLAVQAETSMGAKLPSPRLTPEEVVADALDAVEGGTNDEVFAGTLTKNAYQAFSADPKGFQAKMLTRLP